MSHDADASGARLFDERQHRCESVARHEPRRRCGQALQSGPRRAPVRPLARFGDDAVSILGKGPCLFAQPAQPFEHALPRSRAALLSA